MRCYFKSISESKSFEARKYRERFNLNFERCKNSCSGYLNYGTCERFVTSEDFELGKRKLEDFLK